MERHETPTDSDGMPTCAWCGSKRSGSWRGHGSRLYCSIECETAASTDWTTAAKVDTIIPLVQETIQRDALEDALRSMASKESMLYTERVTPEAMLARAWHVFKNMNLHIVIKETRSEGALFSGHTVGWAKSAASGKHVAVDISVTGLSGVAKNRCKVLVYCVDGTESVLITDEVVARITGKAPPPRPTSVKLESPPRPAEVRYPKQSVAIRGQAKFLEDEIRISVRVDNESLHPVSDIDILIISYPLSSFTLVPPTEVRVPSLGRGQTQEAVFHLRPVTDCIIGEIVAAALYSDANGTTHAIGAAPFPLKAVCTLSLPEQVDASTFERELAGMESGEITINLENLSSHQMYERAVAALAELKFHQVSTNLRNADGLVMGELNGWSRGRYTKRKLGLSIVVYGPDQGIGCSCRIVVYAEDDMVIFPAIEEVRHTLKI